MALEPELIEDEMSNARKNFLQTLKVDAESQLRVSNQTIGQFDNPIYRTERANRLTASNFGLVIKRRDYTSCHSLVKAILSPTNFTSDAIEFGKIKAFIVRNLKY